MRAVLLAVVFGIVAVSAVRSPLTAAPTPSSDFRKKNAGPASEFGMYTLPDPRTGGITSNINTESITLTQSSTDASTYAWEGSVTIDSTTLAQLTFFTRLSDINVEVKFPNAKAFIPADVLTAKFKDQTGKVIENSFGLGGDKFPSTTYYFLSPKQGTWGVRLTAPASVVQRLHAQRKAEVAGGDALPQVMLMTFNESPLSSDAYLGSFESLKQGNTVEIRANLWQNTLPRTHQDAVVRPGSPLAQVESVVLDLVLPDGSQQSIPMNDEGVRGDLVANDGVYGAQFTAQEVGAYVAEVVLAGKTETGAPFVRNSLHMVSVVRSDLVVNSAQITEKDNERFLIHLVTNAEPTVLTPEDDVTHRAYAEVWGTTANGMVPVCWVSGMTDLAALPAANGKLAFDLELNARWLSQAGATEPLELRNVYVQERNAWVPVSNIASLPVTSNGLVSRKLLAMPRLAAAEMNVITDEMRFGVNPYKSGGVLAERAAAATEDDGYLLLVHGYCAPANNFPVEQFTKPAVFEDFNQNRPTDLFARMIKEFGDKYPAFAIVTHSHGGLASTHLNAAYWSNLNVRDDGSAPLVQSVGSPYQGVPVSGLIASLGKALGMGCGSIEDLTYDGAKLWLAGVPAEQRKDTYFYTTQYETGHLVNYCNIASNAVLDWPNDGVTEVVNNQLPGANNMGHKKAWCHSEGMHYPGQCKDADRNAYMNGHAKR